eukprot:s137_g8.t1
MKFIWKRIQARLLWGYELPPALVERKAGGFAKEFGLGVPTPLMMVKVLMVVALLKGLLMSALDVGDALLQVLQHEDVVVAAPNWVRTAAANLDLAFWQLFEVPAATA